MTTPAKKEPLTRRTVCIPEALDARIARLARLECRSRSAQIAFMLEKTIDRHEARAACAAEGK